MVLEHRAWLSVGANLGDRRSSCVMALDMLDVMTAVDVTARSSAYETDPVGFLDQPPFINMAAEILTGLEPMDLLLALKDIEKKMGRRPGLRWGPRIIDMDIVLYDELSLDTQSLIIPHPRMHERAFVLEPLCEIAPHVRHPVFERTVRDLLRSVDNGSPVVRKLDD